MTKAWKTLKAVVELPVQGPLTEKAFVHLVEAHLRSTGFVVPDLGTRVVQRGNRAGRVRVKSATRAAAARTRASSPADLFPEVAAEWPIGTKVRIEHDEFVGYVRGYYAHEDGKIGVVLRQEGTKVTHVYSTKWLRKA